MTGAELRAYREKRGWTQKQLADLLNSSLDRNYAPTKLSKWEHDKLGVPDIVASFLTDLRIEEAFPSEPRPIEGEYEPPEPDYTPPADDYTDTAPPPPPGQQQRPSPQLALTTGGAYARVCEELWEMVATGVGLVGAATGSDTLRRDGEIILADKKALGQAWGKLAETNKTFERMLMGTVSGGAAMQLALVTGMTAGKIVRNHQSAPRDPVPEPAAEDDGVVRMYGDNGVVTFPQTA